MNGRVSLTTLGCKTNQFESAAMEEHLRRAGYEVVPFDVGADLVIVNTCTVTSATDAQSRNLVRRARRLNPRCRVVVTGCYAQVDPEALRAIPGVSLVLGNDEKKDFLQWIEKSVDGQVVQVSPIREITEASVLSTTVFAERSRAFVQIQNGCDAFCSYCIIPYARGRSRSVQPEEVVAQVAGLVEAGYPEIVLTGIHIGGYGTDLTPSLTLTDLVRRLESGTSVRRLRLGSLEPTEITDELIELVAGSSVICPHFHIPLQAGDDQVLRRMNRHYQTAFFRDLVQRIHRRLPQAAIGLDVIAGFPGETEDEFANTLALVESLPVSHLHVFPYSRRPGTPAASMAAQVPSALARERAARLRAVGEEKTRIFARRFVGQTLEVVVEGGGRNGWRKGLTTNYLQVHFRGGDDLPDKTLRVRLTGLEGEGLVGELA
ncbi:tRNA (N(6)-L-threonylcarbamoyladenosine(37)-C(2))-methylthiotransferase MtaB [Desulfuromonas sp. KJ2020]|uniref:tRNA (N(6)-L-threonylcarbamoyladenosine(37)-C(2))- methylthiotransferase MtaB n=1 Tax=Desulfuromonas sp. KJ2020 TaxID=2919173 RepID=UPI0020A81FF7|nr:tRNA (N(6)-L-threonylcarbamoyladenosine(37)-C(2))-methylthiotransferase MtaB [Desulfuromonas sp. KJ2020]MCP3177980.1 tRNA (N(6)-L-threonylcarbamoyladenosine(37)-C(2))-methylthiotransferase MtaB [Desulfuromonas sp. KJ2020]